MCSCCHNKYNRENTHGIYSFHNIRCFRSVYLLRLQNAYHYFPILLYLLYGHLLPKHSWFSSEKVHTIFFGTFISTPIFSDTNSAAARIAVKEFRLQHLGPPYEAILARARDVASLDQPQVLDDSGVVSVMMLRSVHINKTDPP